MSGSPVPYALYARPGESLLVSARPDPGGSRVPGLRYNDCPYADGTFRRLAAAVRRPLGAAGAASRSGASGSVTVPDSSSKSPCASLVTAAGTGGARSATARRPDRTSSGRTAGVSVPNYQPQYRTGVVPAGLSACGASASVGLGDGAPGVEGAHAVLGLALDLDGLGGEERGHGLLGLRRSRRPAAAPRRRRSAGRRGPEVRTSTASMMSSPVGSDSSSRARSFSGSRCAVRAISRYSASVPTPVGAALAYDTLGCGVKPAEYAMGTSARRRARSKARWKSRWLVNRRRPRLV